MNTSGEAADQVVRMSLEVGEAALKISGTGAKHLAVMLYAVLKEKKKTKGRARLETLVRSGRPLTVFSVKESDLKQFVQEAKRYGVLYCAVRNPKGSSDGLIDVIVKEEDAPRINRIVDRFQFASVTEAAKIKTEIERTRAEKAKAGKSEKQEKKPEKVQDQQEKQGQAEPEKDYPQKSKEDQLMDELFGESVKKEGKEQNPSLAKTTKSRLSEPTSKKQEKTAEGTSKSVSYTHLNVKPSKEDMIVTKKLQKCGQLLGIELLDHIIVGGTNGRMLSFREEKLSLIHI